MPLAWEIEFLEAPFIESPERYTCQLFISRLTESFTLSRLSLKSDKVELSLME